MDVTKLFNVKRPCENCPFRKEGGVMLPEKRLNGIIDTLKNDLPFHCHRTIDYTKSRKSTQLKKASYCAGGLIYMEKTKQRNALMRLGMALEMYDPSKLKGHDEVIDPGEVPYGEAGADDREAGELAGHASER